MNKDDAQKQLIDAVRRDRETRARLAQSGALFDGYHPDMEAVHLDNARLLEEVIAAIGWPGRGKVGDDGAAAAFVILQHAISRPDLQRRGLELILDAIPEGQANPLDAAYLADRIAMYEGTLQTFGTQFDYDENGLLSPSPVRDPDGLDERRASVGLPPMAETVAAVRAQAAADNEPPPNPAEIAERRAKFEAWARRVGWRA
ncbi:MAG: DUF6624 domain-containing protein [Hyphomonadaceae bacterium]|nr:DUF6624 domain-containing protein [Hyphomonadaceae bacterium]